MMIFFSFVLAACSASTFRQRTSETPASTIVENWRQKIERSRSFTRPNENPPPAPAFFTARAFRTLDTWKPCSRRRRATTRSFSASMVPCLTAPVLSRTVYAKVGIVTLRYGYQVLGVGYWVLGPALPTPNTLYLTPNSLLHWPAAGGAS